MHAVVLVLPESPATTCEFRMADGTAGRIGPRLNSKPFPEQLDLWLDSLTASGVSAEEVQRSKAELKRVARDLALTTAADATFETLTRWIADRREGRVKGTRKCGGKTLYNVLCRIRGFFKFAKSAGWIVADPSAEIRAPVVQENGDGSRAFTLAEVRGVIQSAAASDDAKDQAIDRRCNGDRKYLYVFLALSPFRTKTVRRLTWSMYRPNHQRGPRLIIPPQLIKKAKKPFAFPLAPEAVQALDEWRKRTDKPGISDPIFPKIPDHRTLYQDLERAGFSRYTEEGGCGYNSFRCFFMTSVAKKAAPLVMNALTGHKDIRTTMKHYINQHQLEADEVAKGLSVLAPAPTAVEPVEPAPQELGGLDTGLVPSYVGGSSGGNVIAGPNQIIVIDLSASPGAPGAHTTASRAGDHSTPSLPLITPLYPEMTPRGFEPLGAISGMSGVIQGQGGVISDARETLGQLAESLRGAADVIVRLTKGPAPCQERTDPNRS